MRGTHNNRQRNGRSGRPSGRAVNERVQGRGGHRASDRPAVRRHDEEGVIHITSRGSGYVTLPGHAEDIEVHDRDVNTALNNDTVRIALFARKKGERERGEVVSVVRRARTKFTGVLERDNGRWFLVPDDRRVYADMVLTDLNGRTPELETKATVELTDWKRGKSPEARLLEILGPVGLHETEMRSIVASHGFDWRYPEAALTQANEIHAARGDILTQAIGARRDVRGTPTFTIDPSDAKDFDDAISVNTRDDGLIELGIHIADVSAYVPKGSSIDKEAYERGTSIYLVDRTIPMLPEVLSNDLCSLVPHEDRLAFSAIFVITSTGEVRERWFGETIIRSDHRFSYEEAQELLTAMRGDPNRTDPLGRELLVAADVSAALRKARFAHGSIAFDTDEVKFELDATGRPVRAFRKVLLETNHLIEDLMLLANREVALFVAKYKGAPFIYRIHDAPKRDRIEELALYLKMLGYELTHSGGAVTVSAINKLFEDIEGKPEQDMIETATIRAMAKAVYSTKNIGHFGLAFDYYTHFTSPIRRYPDLVVHRTMKDHLAGHSPTGRDVPYFEGVAAHSSEREVAAMEAERNSIKLKQCEYLADKVGQTFNGIVTGIAEWGIFVEELETKAEGLVRISTLRDDIYTLTDHGFRLSASISEKGFSIGDALKVRLAGVDVEHRLIDWDLAV